MINTANQMAEFTSLIDKLTPQEGVSQTCIPSLLTFRDTYKQNCSPRVYSPGIMIGAQGRKHVCLDGKVYDYTAGNYLALFMPMPVEIEIIEASPEKPLLGIGLYFEQERLMKLLLKLDRIKQSPALEEKTKASAIYTAPLGVELLDAIIRLLKTLRNPVEAMVLGDGILDEIYYRILSDEPGGNLRLLLQQHGQIQQLSKAVEVIHQNLRKNVTVPELADIVNMSSSGFHKKFKEVMHLSPLQYAKSVKLSKAQTFILEGKSVSEAGYLVGYNSPAQFSREYKRYFGNLPSEQK